MSRRSGVANAGNVRGSTNPGQESGRRNQRQAFNLQPDVKVAKLFLLLIVGLALMLVFGRLADRRPTPVPLPLASPPVRAVQRAATPSIGSPAETIGSAAAGSVPIPENRTPLIAQLARLEARRRLNLAGHAVYLDSLLIGPDSVVRRWGEGAVLRVLIGRPPEALPVVEAVDQALRAWQSLGLGPTFAVTEDSAEANVLVGWVPEAGSERTGLADVQSLGNGEIKLVRISLARTDGKGRVLGLEETRSVALHEFGHALGLPHSGRPSDIMYPTVSVSGLSDRDRSTAQLLYLIPPGALREPPPP